MDTSKFLSKVLGIYFIIISFGMLVNMHQFTSHVLKLINDASLMYVTGFFTLILGLLMVVSHNIWQWNWRLIITILSWIVLLKGASIIFFPQFLDSVTIHFVHNIHVAYFAAGFDFLLGVLLVYLGFKHSQ